MRRAASMKPKKCGIPVVAERDASWYDEKVNEARKQRERDGKPPYIVACRLPDGMIAEFCEPVFADDGSCTVDADIYCKGELVREEHGIQGFGGKWTGNPHFFDSILMLFESYWDEIVASAEAKGLL